VKLSKPLFGAASHGTLAKTTALRLYAAENFDSVGGETDVSQFASRFPKVVNVER